MLDHDQLMAILICIKLAIGWSAVLAAIAALFYILEGMRKPRDYAHGRNLPRHSHDRNRKPMTDDIDWE